MANDLTGYDLSRNWFDFCFENPEKISPNHHAIFFFAIEHCNRLGWKEKFGFPTQMAMDAIGIKKHETYIRYFLELCEWGFLKLVQRSVNQYSANIIALSLPTPKNGKALGKAILIHAGKQTHPIGESNSSIDKPITINHKQESKEESLPAPSELLKSNLFRQPNIPSREKVYEVFKTNGGTKEMADKFWDNNEATGWYVRGSPITNFVNLIPSFISNWKNFDKTTPKEQVNSMPYNRKITSEYLKKYDV